MINLLLFGYLSLHLSIPLSPITFTVTVLPFQLHQPQCQHRTGVELMFDTPWEIKVVKVSGGAHLCVPELQPHQFQHQFAFNTDTFQGLYLGDRRELWIYFSTEGLLSSRLKNHDELVKVAVVPQKLLHHCFHSACVPCPAASRPYTGELVGERVSVWMCILCFDSCDSCKCDCKCTSNVVFKRCWKTTRSINLPTVIPCCSGVFLQPCRQNTNMRASKNKIWHRRSSLMAGTHFIHVWQTKYIWLYI